MVVKRLTLGKTTLTLISHEIFVLSIYYHLNSRVIEEEWSKFKVKEAIWGPDTKKKRGGGRKKNQIEWINKRIFEGKHNP